MIFLPGMNTCYIYIYIFVSFFIKGIIVLPNDRCHGGYIFLMVWDGPTMTSQIQVEEEKLYHDIL